MGRTRRHRPPGRQPNRRIPTQSDHGHGLRRPAHQYDATVLGLALAGDHRTEGRRDFALYAVFDADGAGGVWGRAVGVLKREGDFNWIELVFVRAIES